MSQWLVFIPDDHFSASLFCMIPVSFQKHLVPQHAICGIMMFTRTSEQGADRIILLLTWLMCGDSEMTVASIKNLDYLTWASCKRHTFKYNAWKKSVFQSILQSPCFGLFLASQLSSSIELFKLFKLYPLIWPRALNLISGLTWLGRQSRHTHFQVKNREGRCLDWLGWTSNSFLPSHSSDLLRCFTFY